MMKVLQKILFTFAMVVGLSLAASAQQDDPKKPPPKEKPPVITPAPKPPKKDDKPKRSFVEIAVTSEESFDSIA